MKKWGLQQLAALVLSILLWGYVHVSRGGLGTTQTLAQLTLNVPIRIENAPSSLSPYDILQPDVRVTLQAEAAAVGNLREGHVKAYVDLTGVEARDVWPQVKVLAPGGFTVVSQDPREVNVKLSPSASRPVPLKVQISGSPANGLTVGEPRLEMTNVRVAGPEALVTEVQEVRGRVVLDGQSRDYSLELRDLMAVNSQGTEVTAKLGRIKILPGVVGCTIPILAESRTVAVQVLLNQLRITPASGWTYRLEVEPQFVTLRLGRGQKPPKFLQTKPQNIAVSTKVDSRELDLIIPDGVEVVGSSTVTLKVIPERSNFTNDTEPSPSASSTAPPDPEPPLPSPVGRK